jgi:OOP family OmpA-OmpF porin
MSVLTRGFVMWAMLSLAMLLGGCVTPASAPGGFTAAQRAVLEAQGFREQDGNYLLGLNNRVLFDFDSSELKPETAVMLRELGQVLSGSARIEGHASSEGSASYNLALSERRARAVGAMLIEGGMRAGAMRLVGLGASDPVASNDTPEGREQNRRVVIVVTPADAMAR